MAGSLDELMRFLLDEIALSGQQGSTPADVLEYISRFYQNSLEDATSSENCPPRVRTLENPTIDRPFQEQVWKWLTKHPDVHVGRDGTGNKMSLSAIEAQYIPPVAVNTAAAEQGTSASSTLPNSHVQSDRISPNRSRQDLAKGGNGPRVYVTEQRMWLAICGHLKDSTKVFDTEFVLLSVIASHRENGILQGDLVRESGQDKRSVPKRTDLLRDKGYIEKRTVHLKGLKTSRLLLRKFASNIATNDKITPRLASVDHSGNIQEEPIDIHVLTSNLFAILKDKQIITRDDLKKEMDMTTKWRARVLARVVRKFEVLGCLKRVKAASEASKNVRHFFYCIKLMREPLDQDFDAFHRTGTTLINGAAVEDPDSEDDDAAVQTMAGTEGAVDEDQLQEVDRIVPQWNPDRPLANTLLDLVHEAGIQGLTNRELRHNVTGSFVRRPLEHLLTRLTALWLQSQPLHLRHLAIVRDIVLSGTLPVYVQYSFPNFKARVESGLAFWEAVKGHSADSNKKGKKNSSTNEPPSSNVSELDEFGSPASYTPAAQFKGAQATLSQCLLAGQPEDLPLSTRDPTIYIDVDGTYKVQYDRAERGLRSVRQNVTAEASVRLVSSSRQDAMVPRSRGTSPGARKTKEKPPKPPKAPEPPKAPAKPKGRPRKFLRGTERFWQGQFAMARMLADPEQYGSSNSRAGVMSDPAGLALFAARPPQFDTTLVRAIESGLPVPTMPQDINQGWVDSMLPILSRDAKGVYITPKGAQLQKLGKHKSASRVFIFRSSRLRELDFSKRTKIPAVRFLTSSAAHSFPDLHTPFFGETGEDSEDEVTPSSPIMIREQDPARELQVVTSEESGSPHERVFHQSPSIASDKMPAAHEADLSTTPATKKPRGRPRKTATIQSSDSVPLPETGSNSLGGKGLHSSESQAIQTYLPNMPPALTTRSALREKKSGIHEVMLGNKASPASSPEALDRSSVLDTTPKTSGPALQTESSAQAESASAPAGPLEAQERSQDASVALATPAGSGLDSRPKIIPAHTTAVEGSENAQIHVISSLQSLPPSTSGPDTAAAGVTANSEIIHTRRAENSVLNLLEVDDHDSEAFKLVQELTADESQQNHGDDEMNPAKNHLQTDSDMASRSADVQNSLPELSIVNDDSDQEPPRKRSKQDGAGAGSIGILRRKIMLDLMETCSGALPYTTNSLWGAFTTAWQKSGQAGKPDMRTIKAVVKSLCQNGSAKQIKFSHRNKKGAMATKTILTKSEMATSDPIILEVQKRMIEADPHSYIPIALDIDPKFKRDVERQALQPWPAVFDDQTVDSSVTPAKVHRLQLRETLSRARRGQSRIGPEAKDADKERESGHVVRRPRLAGIRRKYAKDSDSYQRPKLSTYHYPARPQKSFSNRSAKRSLHFRTEISQAPGTFEDAATQNREPLESQAPFTSLRDGDAEPVDSSRSLSTTPHAQQARSVPIVWKKIGDQPVLPSCLDDILLADRRKKKPDYSKENVPSYREFEWIIDGVSKWECRSLNLFNSKSENWAFINHSVGKDFQPAKDSESRVTFNGLIWYDQRGREHTEKRFHDNALDTLTPRLNNNRSLLHGQPQSASGNTPTKRRFPFDLGERARKRRRGRSPLRQPQTITDSAGNLVDVSHLIGAKYKRPRGTQHLRTMPELLVYKLTVTIVVVRALAGGLEKHVDWPLVMAVFPNEDEQFLRDRWKTLSNKNRREISKLSENFQNRFPDAYARGEIQQIDLDGLENVDWEGIVQWALTNLDKPVMHDIPDLPATKSDFDENINLMIESSSRPYRELFGYNQAVTVPIKEAAISALPFAVPLQSSSSQIPKHPPHLVDPTDETDDPSLTLAKSWALSTIITPLSTFDAAKAHMKLQSLASTATQSETLVKSAMKLLSKSVVKKRDKALDAKGRRYDLSRVFTDTLDQRRTINATTLRQALQYKTTILDPAFGRDERVRFNPVTVEDGDMVAILNLVANGRIRLKVGDDVCRNRWGIDQESRYQTRSIRKESLYFTVLIEQVPESYVFGNPLLEKDVPILELGAKDRDLIPVWRDINGDFQQDFWDLAVAAVLGILATRPGAALREVSKMMNPALEMWEVECLLAWCLELGAVKKTGEEENDEGGWTGGWEVREWWWLILEYGRKEKEGQS